MNSRQRRRHNHQLDKAQFREVCRVMQPSVTDQQFHAQWAEFVMLKNARRTLSGTKPVEV